MRLIDADAPREQILDWISEQVVSKYATHAECIKAREGARVALNILENAPTVPAEVVVHCRDCKYKTQSKVNKKGFLICPASGMEITDNDYCSYGERRESEESK